VTLGDLRAPSILVNERVMGDLKAVGDQADIRYRARNSSRKSAIAAISMTDTLPDTLDILSVDERCDLDGFALSCDLGDYEAGQREDIFIKVAATQAFIDAAVNVKDTKPVFEFVPENILTNNDFTLDNFRKVFNASDFWTVLWASMYYTIAGTVGALVMGLFAAQLMNITFRGRSFLRGLYLSPYVAPVIAVALAWVLLLDPGPGGTLNALLIQLGVIEGPISFLGQRAVDINILGMTFAFPVALTVVIIFEIWRYFPLAMLFILARMQSMNTDIYEAAEIDGATPLQQFRFISLPQLMGIMAVLALWGAITAIIVTLLALFISGLTFQPQVTAGAIAGLVAAAILTSQSPAKRSLGMLALTTLSFVIVLVVASGAQPLGLGLGTYSVGQVIFTVLLAVFAVQAINLTAQGLGPNHEKRYNVEVLCLRFLKGFGLVTFTIAVALPFFVMVMMSLKNQQLLLSNGSYDRFGHPALCDFQPTWHAQHAVGVAACLSCHDYPRRAVYVARLLSGYPVRA